MQTFMIQAQLVDQFEDLYVEALTVEAAIEIARHITTLQHRFTSFVA
jgi:hypothetical protein